VAEATGIVAVRSIHTPTGEMSVTSAIAKALVPELLQGAVDRVAELLGLRSYLTEEFADGVFAKLDRDHRVVSVFDGNTAVNRNALIDQFPLLAAGYRRGRYDEEGVHRATGLGVPPPPFAPDRLALLSSGGCSLVQSLPDAVDRIHAQTGEGLLPPRIAALADRIGQETDTLHEELAVRQRSARIVPASAFSRAERYELCYAAAACLRLWLADTPEAHGGQPTLWHDGLWLHASLRTIATRLGLPLDPEDGEIYNRLVEHTQDGGLPTLLSTPDGEPARSTP
jgi:hypothetical protein